MRSARTSVVREKAPCQLLSISLATSLGAMSKYQPAYDRTAFGRRRVLLLLLLLLPLLLILWSRSS